VHDGYEISMKNNTKGLDKKHSLGRGILILTRIGYQVEQIFPTWNSDRRAFAMVTYENGNKLIIGALHLDIQEKREEVTRFQSILDTL
jgi:hypothetical protein